MLDEHVEFLERVVIDQELDALARGQLALGVLRGDALLAAAEPRAGAAAVEPGKHVFHLSSPSVFQPERIARRNAGRNGVADATMG